MCALSVADFTMHRLWMIFAQTVTVSVAILFVVSTLRPDWIGERKTPPAVTIQEAVAPGSVPATNAPSSYADAAQAALEGRQLQPLLRHRM